MKSYMIVLKNNDYSKEVSDKCISEAKKYGIYPEIFNAINGKDKFADEFLHSLGINKVLNSANALDKFKNSPGVKGCLVSHLSLFLKCIEDNQPYLILEHDGYFIDTLPEDILDHFDDVLHLDSFDQLHQDYDYNIMKSRSKKLEYTHYNNIRPKNRCKYRALIGKEGIRHTYFFGTHGYIIKPHACKKAIAYLQKYGCVPFDWLMNNHNFPNIKGVTKPIVRVHPDYNTRKIKDQNLSTTGSNNI